MSEQEPAVGGCEVVRFGGVGVLRIRPIRRPESDGDVSFVELTLKAGSLSVSAELTLDEVDELTEAFDVIGKRVD